MGFAGAMAVAMAVDALIGWPAWLFARIGHPVTWLGRLIHLLDTSWNRASDPPAFRRAAGVAAAVLVIALATALMSTWGPCRSPGDAYLACVATAGLGQCKALRKGFEECCRATEAASAGGLSALAAQMCAHEADETAQKSCAARVVLQRAMQQG